MTTPKPHNPDGLESPGEGYRFLDEDEIEARCQSYWIERHVLGSWDSSGWEGSCQFSTYRTKLSREELAKLV